MSTFEQTTKDIENSFGSIPGFMKGVPQDVLVHMWPVMKTYILTPTKIPPKYREMIALAAAATMKCPYCEAFHRGVAKMNGATDEELAETATIIGQTAFWSSVLHSMHYDIGTFMKELQLIGDYLTKKAAPSTA